MNKQRSSSHSPHTNPFFLRIRLNVAAFTKDLDVNTFVSYLA